MIMDRSTFYGSRNMIDQHRDMRLDVDNMTYEVCTNFSFAIMVLLHSA